MKPIEELTPQEVIEKLEKEGWFFKRKDALYKKDYVYFCEKVGSVWEVAPDFLWVEEIKLVKEGYQETVDACNLLNNVK